MSAVAPERTTLRTVLRDTCSSRAISLIERPRWKNSRRIRAIVSTPFIPRHPSQTKDRQLARTAHRGVKVARRNTGSAYIAKQTGQTATALGLRLAFTPVRSPESNGVCEAFVKTLRRDYVRLAILPDAEAAMRLLPGWFEDYNTLAPHAGLKMLSPREFLRLSA